MLGISGLYVWHKRLLCLGWFAGCAAGLVACAGFYYVDDVAAQFLKFAYDIEEHTPDIVVTLAVVDSADVVVLQPFAHVPYVFVEAQGVGSAVLFVVAFHGQFHQ